MQTLPSVQLTWICLVFGISSCNAIPNVVLLELLSTSLYSSHYYRESRIMFDKGEEHLRTRYSTVLNVTSVRLHDEDSTTCATAVQKTAFLASRYYYRDMQSAPVTAIFQATGCSRTSEPLGDLAREWNAPLFISCPADTGSWDRKRFPTVTSFSPLTFEDSRMFISRLLDNLKYDKVAIIDDAISRNFTVFMSRGSVAFIRARFPLGGINDQRVMRNHEIHANSSLQEIKRVLEDIRSYVRVVYIIAEGSLVRSIMLAASEMQMTNGEYVFVALDLSPNTTTFGNMSWDTGNSDGRDMEARTAYRSLFTISVYEEVTAEYRSFIGDVKRISAEKYNYTYAPNEEIDPFSIANYYEVVIFGQVLSEHIANGGNPYDGSSLSRSMWNRTFTVLGKKIAINAKGNRVSDWVLNQLNTETGIFEPVVKYSSGDTAVECVRDTMTIGDCLAKMKVTTKPTTERS